MGVCVCVFASVHVCVHACVCQCVSSTYCVYVCGSACGHCGTVTRLVMYLYNIYGCYSTMTSNSCGYNSFISQLFSYNSTGDFVTPNLNPKPYDINEFRH